MAKRKAPRYNHPGGVLGVPRRVIRSPAYQHMKPAARCLMLGLQDVWKPFEPIIHYSTKRAGKWLNMTPNTGALALKELVDHGFIVVIDGALYLNGMAKTYRLTWLSNDGKEPTNEWQEWPEKLNPCPTGSTVKAKTILSVVRSDEIAPYPERRINDLGA